MPQRRRCPPHPDPLPPSGGEGEERKRGAFFPSPASRERVLSAAKRVRVDAAAAALPPSPRPSPPFGGRGRRKKARRVLSLSRIAGEGAERSKAGEGRCRSGGAAPLTPTLSPLRGAREKKESAARSFPLPHRGRGC